MKTFINIVVIIIIFLTVVTKNANAQDSCGIFNHLQFKNGIDTIVIRAYYDELFKSPDYPILKKLDSAKRLKYTDYGDDSGEEDASAALGFIPENCDKLYYGTIRAHIGTDMNKLKHGEIMYLTCVVFEGEIMGIKNYHVITDVTLKKDDDKPYPPIASEKYLEPLATPLNDKAHISYFTFADWPVNYGFNVLTIDAKGNALIKFNKAYISFNRTSKKERAGGYIDEYFNKNYKLILTIDSIKGLRRARTLRTGTLEIISKTAAISFPIHGIDKEMDRYNYSKFLRK